MRDRRTFEIRAEATRRLAADGSAMRLEELATIIHISVFALVRWACQGKRGHHLDAMRVKGGDWFSSWAAVERFRDATGKGKRLSELLTKVLGS